VNGQRGVLTCLLAAVILPTKRVRRDSDVLNVSGVEWVLGQYTQLLEAQRVEEDVYMGQVTLSISVLGLAIQVLVDRMESRKVLFDELADDLGNDLSRQAWEGWRHLFGHAGRLDSGVVGRWERESVDEKAEAGRCEKYSVACVCLRFLAFAA
jgi:hypothetical protein